MRPDLTPIGTICHSNHSREEGVRVTLYRTEGDSCVWCAADGEEPYRSDVPLGREHQAWAGREWDLQMIDA